MLLSNEWANNKIKEEIKRYLGTFENEDTTMESLWDTGKAILRGKFITLQAYVQKTRKAQINNLTSHLKELEKEQQTKLRESRRKDIIKIRVELNDIGLKE